MMSIISRLPKSIRNPAHAGLKRLKKLLKYPEPYGFFPAKSIEEQLIHFNFRGKKLSIAAGYGMPLYDTLYEILEFDAYQLERLNFSDNTKKTILDIGANIGACALILSQVPNSDVICFEPFPDNCSVLKANLARNHLTNVTVIQSALSNRDGVATFLSKPDENVGGYLLGETVAKESNMIEVKALSLKTALECVPAGDIFLIKADCEGGEYDIVNQMNDELAQRIKNLTFEIHDRDRTHNLKTISKQLGALGYKLFHRRDFQNRKHLHHLLASR